MRDFLFVYHGPLTPMTEAQRAASDTAWRAWIGRHRDSFADIGCPARPGVVIAAGGEQRPAGPAPATGYTRIHAPDLDAAARIASENPMVMAGLGTIEISELIPFET